MRTRLDQLAAQALEEGSAVPALTCYDFTTALAVVNAAEEGGRGLVLLVASKTAGTSEGLRLVAALRGLADAATAPVVVQLDHASNLRVVAEAVAAGVDSVLVDGSSLPYEDNVSLVLAGRALVGPGIVVEAELGGLAGDEDRAFTSDGSGVDVCGLTDPARVEEFVSRTGAELLAVAVGNVHGKYQGEPQLRWDVLRDITGRTDLPLVLHGASGIPAEDLVKATELNVGKINVNTELRTGILATLQERLPGHRADGENLAGLLSDWNRSARDFAADLLAVLGR
jgi:tagatose 1,6-diphosphate aldolase GatY/KbaY